MSFEDDICRTGKFSTHSVGVQGLVHFVAAAECLEFVEALVMGTCFSIGLNSGLKTLNRPFGVVPDFLLPADVINDVGQMQSPVEE